MRVTLLGHASVLVEVRDKAVLIDPVFQDTFAEGMLTTCPSRRMTLSRLPKIDVLVLTDAQPDHFDIPTLARLSRDCAVVSPQDARILYALEKLGFKRVRPTPAPAVVKVADGLEIITTASIRKAAEFGVAIKARTGTMWHPAATLANRAIVAATRAQLGRIDLLLASYAFQEFSYFGVQRPGFPGPFLRACVALAQDIAPGLLVPSSAGIRFADPFAWTNPFLFPIARERFLADVARSAPNLPTAQGDPGDVFELRNGTVERRAGASALASMVHDDTHLIAFDPAAPVPALSDPNLDGYSADTLDRQVSQTLDELAAFVTARYTTDPVVQEHRTVQGSYGVGVVFPGGRERWLSIQFGPTTPTIERGEGHLGGPLKAIRIAASVLTARARYERNYPYPGGLTRFTGVSAARLVNGQVAIETREPTDLLMHTIKLKPPGWDHHWKRILDFQLAPVLGKGRVR